MARAARDDLSAAASLRGALDEVARAMTVMWRYPLADRAPNGAGRLMAGACQMVVLLAAPVLMDWLRDRGAVDPDAVVDLLGKCVGVDRPRRPTMHPTCRSGQCPWAMHGWLWGSATLCPLVSMRVNGREDRQWKPSLPQLAETVTCAAALALVAAGRDAAWCGHAPTPMAKSRRSASSIRHPKDYTQPEITYPCRGLNGQRGPPHGGILRSEGARAGLARLRL